MQGRSSTFPCRALLKAFRSQALEEEDGHELVEKRPAWGLDQKQQGFMNQPFSPAPVSLPLLPGSPHPFRLCSRRRAALRFVSASSLECGEFGADEVLMQTGQRC